MALSDDEMRCLIRGWCWTYWGRGPTTPEQQVILQSFQKQGADLCLAGITDHPAHAEFRKRRDW